MATVELAVAIPALVAVLILTLGAVRLGVDRLGCEEAAYQGVRALGRGMSAAEARAVITARAPRGSEVHTSAGGGLVSVSVTAPEPTLLTVLPGIFRASATLTGVSEQLDHGAAPS